MIHKNISKKTISLFIILVFLFLTGCETTDPNQTTLSMSFVQNSSLSKISADDIQIGEVKLLIRNIKIKNQAFEDTLHFKTGPLVVNLDLQGNTTEFAVSEIPAGTYNRVRFEIHKLEDSETPPDAEFKDGTESSNRYSVIVKGTLNGDDFIYKSRKSAHQDIKLDEDLIVEENTDANLTIMVDPLSWFYEGDNFLNPNDSSNSSKIDNNLQTSFKRAFKDQDRDGVVD